MGQQKHHCFHHWKEKWESPTPQNELECNGVIEVFFISMIRFPELTHLENTNSPVYIHRCLDIPIEHLVLGRHWINALWIIIELNWNSKTEADKNPHSHKHTGNHLDEQAVSNVSRC
jgi:hypothetical protein